MKNKGEEERECRRALELWCKLTPVKERRQEGGLLGKAAVPEKVWESCGEANVALLEERLALERYPQAVSQLCFLAARAPCAWPLGEGRGWAALLPRCLLWPQTGHASLLSLTRIQMLHVSNPAPLTRMSVYSYSSFSCQLCQFQVSPCLETISTMGPDLPFLCPPNTIFHCLWTLFVWLFDTICLLP